MQKVYTSISQILPGSLKHTLKPKTQTHLPRPLSSAFVTSSEASPIIARVDQPINEIRPVVANDATFGREGGFQKIFGALHADFPPIKEHIKPKT